MLKNHEVDNLFYKVFLTALCFIFFVLISNLLLGKVLVAKGFLLGSTASLIYLRLQALYSKNFAKTGAAARFNKILANGRILIVLAVLFVAVKRTDVFDTLATLWGFFSIHLISIMVFAYNVFKEQKKNKIGKQQFYSN